MSSLRVLLLSPDNPCNCHLVDQQTQEIGYKVSTEHGRDTVTFLKDASDNVIASWKWRDYSSDILTLGEGQPRPASSWIKKSLIPFKT